MTPLSDARARALVVLTAALLVGSAAATAIEACSTDSFDVQSARDGGDDGAALDRADCPKTAPAKGSPCLLPEGTTCDFGSCGVAIAQCSQGSWRFAANTPPRPSCPEVPPNPDVSCPVCWPATNTCTYGSTNCSLPDASINTAVASCPQGKWVLDIRPCRDGGEPDVQGDGGLDAD